MTSPVEAAAVLGEIGAILASGIGNHAVLPMVVPRLRAGLGLERCAVWVRTRAGDAFHLAADAPGPDPEVVTDVTAWEQPHETVRDGGMVVRLPLVTDGKPLGLLGAVVSVTAADRVRTELEIVRNMLALWLASTELSEDLASEVARRTREIDAHRRFTARIIDSLPLGLYVIDREYRIQAWNRKREAGLQGVSREEAMGRRVFDILHRQPRDLLQREFDEVFATGEIKQIDVTSEASGSLRFFRISKIPMRLDDAEVTHVITLGEGVTQWKSMHQQITQTEKLAAVGQLAAGVMHELNNPLATIGACVEALTSRMPDLPPADQQMLDEYLRIVDSELERCNAIVDGLLDFSHPKAQAKQPEVLNQIVDDALFLVRHHDAFRNITLVRRLAPGLAPIHGNAKQLVQVFLAIMLNAIDAMEGRGTLTVTTGCHPDREGEAVVTISDTGLGIPREDLSKIFEPFFTTKVTGRGTGLGLSICYAMVQEHRGRIVVDSTPGSGSTFRVFLPLMAPDADGAA